MGTKMYHFAIPQLSQTENIRGSEIFRIFHKSILSIIYPYHLPQVENGQVGFVVCKFWKKGGGGGGHIYMYKYIWIIEDELTWQFVGKIT